MKRIIRLKEHWANLDDELTAPEGYLNERDDVLGAGPYRFRTDENGFIISGEVSDTVHSVIFLGDSVIENIYIQEKDRMCAVLERKLRDDRDLDVRILNGGYSGASTLHLLNVFINKIIPLKPTAVVLMTGIIDREAMRKKAGYWSSDKYLQTIVYADEVPGTFDTSTRDDLDFFNREKLLQVFSDTARLFQIPLVMVTTPLLATYGGKYVKANYPDPDKFWREVEERKAINASTKRICEAKGIHCLDIEGAASGDHSDFQDNIHLSATGAAKVADALVASVLPDYLRSAAISRCAVDYQAQQR